MCGPNKGLADPNQNQNKILQHSPYFIKGRKILLIWYSQGLLHNIWLVIEQNRSRNRIVEWPWIEFKMRPMLFKKSWNLFYSNVVGRPAKLAWLIKSYSFVLHFLGEREYRVVCFGKDFDLRIHWRLSTILKISKTVFLVCKSMCIFESLFNALYIEIKHKCW